MLQQHGQLRVAAEVVAVILFILEPFMPLEVTRAASLIAALSHTRKKCNNKRRVALEPGNYGASLLFKGPRVYLSWCFYSVFYSDKFI